MKTYQERMVKEYRDLADKIVNLESFISKHKGNTLVSQPVYPVGLMELQLHAMKTYANILEERGMREGFNVRAGEMAGKQYVEEE